MTSATFIVTLPDVDNVDAATAAIDRALRSAGIAASVRPDAATAFTALEHGDGRITVLTDCTHGC